MIKIQTIHIPLSQTRGIDTVEEVAQCPSKVLTSLTSPLLGDIDPTSLSYHLLLQTLISENQLLNKAVALQNVGCVSVLGQTQEHYLWSHPLSY